MLKGPNRTGDCVHFGFSDMIGRERQTDRQKEREREGKRERGVRKKRDGERDGIGGWGWEERSVTLLMLWIQ